ncbi:MAG TPA: UvrD-helicase domain-containing protein, partial [Myxococcota bacterium]|nr:UvrD-helicase domain-containing protein [Myxococcota bacterium]
EAGFSDATQVLGESGDDAQLFWEACEDAWFGADPACAEAVQTLAPFVSVDYELPWALWDAINRAREDDQPIGAALLGQYDPVATQARVHEALTGLRAQLAAARGQVTGKGVEKLAAFLEAPLPDPAAEPSAFAQAWRLAFGCLDRRGTLGKVFSEADKSAVAQGLEHVLAEAQCHALAPALSVLLERGWQAYTRTKSLLRALDFADIIERFVAVLSHREDLHAAVRRRYKAVLVDEAQDTNRLQRRLVNLLAGFDGPAKGTTPHASLFVVGDWKQSIYTFRGADPRSFALFARDLQERGGTETTLSVSRRSQARLVAGINDLGVSLFGDDYEPLE